MSTLLWLLLLVWAVGFAVFLPIVWRACRRESDFDWRDDGPFVIGSDVVAFGYLLVLGAALWPLYFPFWLIGALVKRVAA